MSIVIRHYDRSKDFERVGDFLIENYRPGNTDGNWLQPAWEYMHTHPALDERYLDRIGFWEDEGRIVAVAHYESRLGEAFFQLQADYTFLKPRLLEYAEATLCAEKKIGKRYLHAFVNDCDPDLEALVNSRGYQRDERRARPIAQCHIIEPFRPEIRMPDGFQLMSLAEDNDLQKIDRVLWRGFNHGDEPPEGGMEQRKKMQSGLHFRKDLNIVAVAPNGEFTSYCGMWYEARNQIAYVEPVATDPAYQRLGLGKAAVLEGIRRCAELGARIAFVGSDLPFYRALGFQKIYTSNCWTKTWKAEVRDVLVAYTFS